MYLREHSDAEGVRYYAELGAKSIHRRRVVSDGPAFATRPCSVPSRDQQVSRLRCYTRQQNFPGSHW
jgi:hypothetical protein